MKELGQKDGMPMQTHLQKLRALREDNDLTQEQVGPGAGNLPDHVCPI